MVIGLIILAAIIVVLCVKLQQKQSLDYSQKEQLNNEVSILEKQYNQLKTKIDYENYHLNEIKLDLAAAQQA